MKLCSAGFLSENKIDYGKTIYYVCSSTLQRNKREIGAKRKAYDLGDI